MPGSLIWLRAKTDAKPQAPSHHAPSSNSNYGLTLSLKGFKKGVGPEIGMGVVVETAPTSGLTLSPATDAL